MSNKLIRAPESRSRAALFNEVLDYATIEMYNPWRALDYKAEEFYLAHTMYTINTCKNILTTFIVVFQTHDKFDVLDWKYSSEL